MNAEPQKEHEWLQKLVGEWTSETEPATEGEAAGEIYRGTESIRPFGSFWVIAEGKGDMCGGGDMETRIILGYDPQKGSYVGTWIGSIMATHWVYSGHMTEDGKKLNLDSEGPSFSGDGTTAQYRDQIEFLTDDHRVLRSLIQNEAGEWTQFMATHYYRKA